MIDRLQIVTVDLATQPCICIASPNSCMHRKTLTLTTGTREMFPKKNSVLMSQPLMVVPLKCNKTRPRTLKGQEMKTMLSKKWATLEAL